MASAALTTPLKPKGTPIQAVCAATFACALGIAGISAVAPAAKAVSGILSLNGGQKALLIAMPTLSGSLLRIPFGAAVDETGGKKPIMILLGLSMIGMLGLSVIMSFEERLAEIPGVYPMILLCAILAGCGGAIFVVGAGQSSYWFPSDKQGSVLGAYGGIGNLPPGLVVLGFPIAHASFSFFQIYVAWLTVLGLGTAAYFYFGQNAWYFQLKAQGMDALEAESVARDQYKQELFPKGSATQSLKLAACNPKTWGLVALYFTNFGGYLAMTLWLPTFYMETHGFEEVEAALWTMIYSEGCCLSRAFLGGPIADRFGGEVALLGAFPVVGLGAFFLVLTETASLHIAASAVMSISMGICNASIFKLVPKYVPEALGGAAGWVGGLGAFGGFVLPPVLQAFVTAQGTPGYKNGFSVYVGLAVLGWTIVFGLKMLKDAQEAKGADHSSSDDDSDSDSDSESSDDPKCC